MSDRGTKTSGILYALAAAFLFGASTPLSKLLLGGINSWGLAGLLYLGSGTGLSILLLVRFFIDRSSSSRRGLVRKDWLWLACSTVFGGILAPVLLMGGLARTEASEASLFLNLETLFTVFLAWCVFHERMSRSVLMGLILICLGAVILSGTHRPTIVQLSGPLLVMTSCLCWAIDNNVTRKISASDPVQIAMIKSLVAGAVNVGLALAVHIPFPGIGLSISAGVMGFFCYGISLCCFIMALRHIGTARTSGLFATAPFVGTGLAVVMLGEPLSLRISLAGILMALGVWVYLKEEISQSPEKAGASET